MLFDSEGNLFDDFKTNLASGDNLIAMPIARVFVEWTPRIYPRNIIFYPEAMADIRPLNVILFNENTKSLAEHCSAASGINEDVIDSHSLVVFPARVNWDSFRSCGHKGHLDLIRKFSDYVDQSCLNFIRYCQCPIETIDCLPGRAGQINSNHMMSGALVYNPSIQESRIIGGDAFTHVITKGLGLPLESIDHIRFPKEGEVGSIVNHALRLFTSILEASDSTAKFIQMLSLLEFLAYPYEYRKFEDVKKIIARYSASNNSEYIKLLDRFFELTGKKDSSTNQIIGYRTKLVHMGGRIEDIITDDTELKNIFIELDGYIKRVIDHMINHSDKTYEDYVLIRDSLRPFEAI